MSGNDGEFLEALMANAFCTTIYVDRDGRICFWNAGAERIFGYTREEAIGQRVDIIIPDTQRERHWQGFFSRIGTGWVGRRKWSTLQAQCKDSTTPTLDATIVPIHDLQGWVKGIAGFFFERTE